MKTARITLVPGRPETERLLNEYLYRCLLSCDYACHGDPRVRALLDDAFDHTARLIHALLLLAQQYRAPVQVVFCLPRFSFTMAVSIRNRPHQPQPDPDILRTRMSALLPLCHRFRLDVDERRNIRFSARYTLLEVQGPKNTAKQE